MGRPLDPKTASSQVDLEKVRRSFLDVINKAISDEVLSGLVKKLVEEVASREERPNFGPYQVRCVCQLKKEYGYFKYTRDEKGSDVYKYRFMVMREPYITRGNWVMSVKINDAGTINLRLDSVGVVPYDDGRWDQYDWIAYTNISRPLRNKCCHQVHEA